MCNVYVEFQEEKYSTLELKKLNITNIDEAPSSLHLIPVGNHFPEFKVIIILFFSTADYFFWFIIFLLLWEPNAQMFPEAQWIFYSSNVSPEF